VAALIDAQLGRLKQVVDTDVPALNKLAQAHGMPEVKVPQ